MFVWLVTVRAAEGQAPRVAAVLRDRLLPLLREQAACRRPTLVRRVNCAGEHTCLPFWASRVAVETFERTPTYRALLDALAPRLRVLPKRELWEVVAD